MSEQAPATRLLADIRQGGGGTYHTADLEPCQPQFGYAVAVGGVTVQDDDRLTEDVLAWAAKAVGSEHRTQHVGTWLDGGVVYVDAVELIRNRHYAEWVGREHGQLAIYDFANEESITLGDEDGEYPLRNA